jgi:hypothetical protein
LSECSFIQYQKVSINGNADMPILFFLMLSTKLWHVYMFIKLGLLVLSGNVMRYVCWIELVSMTGQLICPKTEAKSASETHRRCSSSITTAEFVSVSLD